MRTAFKVGMRVYDQLNFPDMEGEVSDINSKDYKGFPIKVWFSDTCTYYTEEGREELDTIPSLSTKPYTVELKGFEQKVLVPDFEEALDWLDNNKNYKTVFEDERTYPSKEISDASEALRKLIILREYYNEGWQPIWEDRSTLKFCIITHTNKLDKDTGFKISRVMTFKTEEIRDEFFEEQRELLEIAKPLL